MDRDPAKNRKKYLRQDSRKKTQHGFGMVLIIIKTGKRCPKDCFKDRTTPNRTWDSFRKAGF